MGNIQASFNTGKLIRKEPSFLLYEIEAKGYLYIKNYGGIVHFNIFPEHIEKINQYICTICQTHLTSFKETLSIRISNEEPINATFDELVIPQITLDYVHIICLNLSQSAALFQYQNLSSGLLEDTQKYTSELELKGHVSLGRKKLMKFIGAALNLKNKISEHLYIFETPTLAWDDQNINKVDQLLNEDLELKYRYNAIKEQLNIVKENLDHFKDLNLHQHSSKLEWIIIILILFEVIHVIIEKII
ncbi:MAG: RMD1 family protein [Saprospiraceae bacterium]|nr:RMD1 family protein [Bacteroidia bacterium]NNL93766.1 RMD1 family protein [Saprospiraceae bacterium]